MIIFKKHSNVIGLHCIFGQQNFLDKHPTLLSIHGSLPFPESRIFREGIGLDFGMEQFRTLSKNNKHKGILKNPG